MDDQSQKTGDFSKISRYLSEAFKPLDELEFRSPLVDEKFLKALRNPQHADHQFEILMESIKEFENQLDDEHEVAIQLASFGQSIVMSVAAIGYSNPSLIHFYGYVSGQKAELIQHVSQINFLLLAVTRAEPNLPPRRIGFLVDHGDS